MKKILFIAVALLLVAGFAVTAGAEDRLSMRGDYYLRAISIDNPGYNDDVEEDQAYFTQRIRMYLDVKPSDDVRVELRLDWGESEWGMHRTAAGAIPQDTYTLEDDGEGGYTLAADGNGYQQVQIEMANVRIEKDLFILVVGQQGQTFGNGGTWRPQETGIALRFKLPVLIDLNFFKTSEGGSIIDEADGTDDINEYGAQVSYQSKMFKAGIFFAAHDNLETDDNPYTVGLWGGVNIGPVALDAQLDVFGGDNGQDPATDYVGTQAVVGARWPIMEMLTIGADAYYTMGTDADDETVKTRLNTYGPWGSVMLSGIPGSVWDGIRYGSRGSGVFDAHNVIGGNAGEIGGDLWVSVKPVKDLTIGGQVMYFVPAEDDATTTDTYYGVGAGVGYDIAATTNIAVGGIYYQKEFDDDTIPDDGYLGLQLNLTARY